MNTAKTEIDAVVAVIKEYERAASARDTAALRNILALGDPRFREIEDHIPSPFGSNMVEDILGWMDNHPDFAYTVEYRDIEVFLLSSTVAYAVAMNDWQSPDDSGSGRVTFVFVADDSEVWRILHGHWSAMPPMDES